MNRAAALAPKDAERLAKIASLLASDKGGEVIAAAAAGTRLLQAAGLRWADVIAVRPPPPRQARQPPPPEQTHWRSVAAACLAQAHVARLSQWERQFLAGLLDFQRLSPKQLSVLDRLVQRVRAAGGAT